ncbi:proline-specific peptidase [Jackrogersella minutella]|nr:proline-specific peptidase [Jackrogersella minutella]
MTEGIAEFNVAGVAEPCQTWYKVIGDLTSHDSTPLIILHGGPGASHDYLLPLTDLAPDVTLVFYDQIGSGRSTHLPNRANDKAFWRLDLFIRELDNLIAHLGLQEKPFDVYGHSWGGMVASTWASRPSGSTKHLRRLVLAGSPASMDGFRADLSTLRSRLGKDVQAVLNHAEEIKDFSNPEYHKALEVFYGSHLTLTRPSPPEAQAMQHSLTQDISSYLTIFGPNPLVVAGSIRDWTVIPSLHKIKVPTLLIDGSQDTVQEHSVTPLFEHIEKVRWVTLDNAAHLAHVDQRQKYMKYLRQFLTS